MFELKGDVRFSERSELSVASESAVSQLLNCLKAASTLHAFVHPIMEVHFLHSPRLVFSGSHVQDLNIPLLCC
jgi:hypothetical protein